MADLLRTIKHKWMNLRDTTESFAGRNVIVTGATSGIGLEAVVKFASLGASKVILTARDLKKGETVKASIEARTGQKGQLEVWELEMSSYDSIVAFAKRAHTLEHLDVAVLNAGVHNASFKQSKHGFEEDLQTNAISTTLLAILLLPKLKESRRISGKIPVLEFTSSGLHQKVQINGEALQSDNILGAYNDPNVFNAGHQYSISKLFLMFVTNKLAQEISSEDIIITSACPGWVTTDLARDYKFPGVSIALWVVGVVLQRPTEKGSRTIVSGTTLGERSHGRFWQHDEIQPIAPSVAGEENRKIGLRVWNEIVEVLSAEVPAVKQDLSLVLS